MYEETLANGNVISCESRVLDVISFGFNRVTVHTPLYDADSRIERDKRGNPKPDKTKDDTEDIPLTQDIDEYIAYRVKPFNPDAWPDKKTIKVGYTIPFTKTFYRYAQLEPSEDIAARILEHERTLESSLVALFGKN